MTLDGTTVGLASLVIVDILALLRNGKVLELTTESLREYMDVRFDAVEMRLAKLEER